MHIDEFDDLLRQMFNEMTYKSDGKIYLKDQESICQIQQPQARQFIKTPQQPPPSARTVPETPSSFSSFGTRQGRRTRQEESSDTSEQNQLFVKNSSISPWEGSFNAYTPPGNIIGFVEMKPEQEDEQSSTYD